MQNIPYQFYKIQDQTLVYQVISTTKKETSFQEIAHHFPQQDQDLASKNRIRKREIDFSQRGESF